MPSAAWLPMLLAASLTPPPALGTPIRSEPEPEICVTVATVWRGSTEEIRRIAEQSVPESYRRLYSWTSCQYLAKEPFIDTDTATGGHPLAKTRWASADGNYQAANVAAPPTRSVS